MRPRVVLGMFALGLSVSRGAHAEEPSERPDKLQCIDAHRQAQVDQRAGKLKAARQAWTLCTHEACPRLVRRACADGLSEVVDKVPSIVITVREKGGASIPDAEISLDEEVLDAEQRSRSIDVDPGTHVVTAVLPDGRRAERRFTVAPGERQVAVIAELDRPARSEPAPVEMQRPVPVTVYVLGGVAVAGLATFAGFAIAGKNTESCKPGCTDSEIDAMRTQYLIADIGLAAAVIAGGAAVYFYVSRPERSSSERAFVRVRPFARGAGVSIGAEL